MSSNNFDFSMLDDERFEQLMDDVEKVFTALQEEVFNDDPSDATPEELEQILDESIESIVVFLMAFRAEVNSVVSDKDGNSIYELKLTMPASNLQEHIRQFVAQLDLDDLD